LNLLELKIIYVFKIIIENEEKQKKMNFFFFFLGQIFNLSLNAKSRISKSMALVYEFI